MNDIYYYLIIIVIIIVLVLVLILIYQFYGSYNDYKIKINDNLEKTKNYINSTTIKLDNNIKNNTNDINRIDNDLRTRINSVSSDLTATKSDVAATRTNIATLTTNATLDSANLSNMDTNLKRYFEFRDGSTPINQALFNYRFNSTPNLNLLNNITAISGMTVKTDTNNLMRICDNSISTSNCIDMNINNGSFDIFPSPTLNNNINNINIYGKDKIAIAKFDVANSNIYLGSDGDNAALFINKNNVYLRDVNFLAADINYNKPNKITYDKNGSIFQAYDNYKYNMSDIMKLNVLTLLVHGMYTIIQPSTIIINFKSPKDIPIGKIIQFEIPEVKFVSGEKTLANKDLSTKDNIINAKINGKKIIMTNTKPINVMLNIRIKLFDENNPLILDVEDEYKSETTITNIFSTIVD